MCYKRLNQKYLFWKLNLNTRRHNRAKSQQNEHWDRWDKEALASSKVKEEEDVDRWTLSGNVMLSLAYSLGLIAAIYEIVLGSCFLKCDDWS